MATGNSSPSRKLPNLAIDLDGVLTEHPRPLAIAAAAHFDIDLPERAFVDSAGLNVPQAIRDWVYSDDGPASRLAPADGAQAFIQRAIELLGPERVRILTARSAASAAMTRDWLERNNFPPISILFADDKASVALAEGITHAVEDSQRHARSYVDSGLDCFLLVPDGIPADLPETVTIVDSLAHILDLLSAEIGDLADGGLPGGGPRPKIVIADAMDAAAREYIARFADIIDVDGTNLPALLGVLPEADALIVRSETQVTEDVINAGPKLRVIARAGVGVDNVDLDAATRAGVLVLNAPGANRHSAGEHAIALLLAVTRQLTFADRTTRAGEWRRKEVRPIDLNGKTVGVIGLGRVGEIVARRLKSFEMRVLGYDPYITPERFAAMGVEQVDYETLLRESDIVTYHVPSTPETRHMLGRETIPLLRPGAIVINAARGDVVDSIALAEALESGHVARAGVDVFPVEPATDHPLFHLDNVILTPHTGGSSREALAAVGEMIATSVISALDGQAVPNAVNLPPASLMARELQHLTQVAGAAGHLLAVLQPTPPAIFRLTVNGNVPDDVTEHVAGAALSEALNLWTHQRVTPVNARIVAADLGLEVRVDSGTRDPNLQPSFTVEASGEPTEGSHQVRVVWNRPDAGIVAIDRFMLDRPLAGELLITRHRDVPGLVGRIGTILGRYEVNIAGMEVGRHTQGGEAIMVVNVDDPIPDGALAEIRQIPGLGTAVRVSLPAELKRVVFAPVGAY